MAFQMIHMAVGDELLQRLGIDEGKEEFIFGCVAPDSAPVDDPEKREKIHSHLFENCGPWGDTQDYDNWISNIKAFWNRLGANETDVRKRMFLLGICVHCLTDYWNDLLIWRAGQKENIPPMTVDEFRAALYPDSRMTDKWLFQNHPHADEIIRCLRDSRVYDLEDYMDVAGLEALKNHLINVQYNLPEPVDVTDFKYYPAKKARWFVKEASDRIVKQLEDIYGV